MPPTFKACLFLAVLLLLVLPEFTPVLGTGWNCPVHSKCSCRPVIDQEIKAVMTSVNCSHLNFTMVPQFGLSKNAILFDIDLSGNQISTVHRMAFPEILFIRRISLSDNPIKMISTDAFVYVRRHLHDLQLADAGLSLDKTPKFLSGMERLENLILDGNGKWPQVIPSGLFDGLRLSKLKFLSLRDCGLTDIAKGAFVGLEQLETLDLSHNVLETIPVGLFSLKSLSVLRLHGNELVVLQEGAFRALPNLATIELQLNKFSSIKSIHRDAFRGLENTLKELNFYNNNLEDVPTAAFRNLNRLKELNLSHNRINSLRNDSFKGDYCLETLDLSGNAITHRAGLPLGIFSGQEACLKTVNLRTTLLKRVPLKQLQSLKRLESIDLSENPLIKINSDIINHLSILRYNFESMGIRKIQLSTFENVSRTPITLDLKDNRIRNISFIVNTKQCTFYKIDLTNNPVFCDCLLEKILSSRMVKTILGSCNNGPLKNMSFNNPSVKRFLINSCKRSPPVQCPYWTSNASSLRGEIVFVMLAFVSMAMRQTS